MFEILLTAPVVLPVALATAVAEPAGGLDPTFLWPDDHFPPPPPK